MKLKSKIFFSYFILILLFSFSLVWLIIEIRELTTSLRIHARRDVHSIIKLSQQLQKLEDLNADYIVLFIPGSGLTQKIKNVKSTQTAFERSWAELKRRIDTPYERPWFDRLFNRIYLKVYGLVGKPIKFSRNTNIDSLTNNVHRRWSRVNGFITQTVTELKNNRISEARYLRDAYVKNDIQQLRQSLTELNRILGEDGIRKSTQMAIIAQKTQWVIMGAEVIFILVTIVISFFVARRLTKPIESLKSAVNRMAIQDFDIEVKNKPNDEIGELGTAFEQLSKRLKETETFKSAMLSQFTHEMKSPLGAIKQSSNLLESSLGDALSGQQKRFLSIIKGNNQKLQKLITDILHSASYDSGKVKLSLSRLNVVKVMTEVLVYLSPLIKEKNIKVNLSFAAKEIICEADNEKLAEVFQNLVSNAVKFSGRNTSIDIAVLQKFPNVIIKIKDRGIGIPNEEIPYIFEKLYRASNSKKISVKGTGLGLYISSRIIHAHGGRIEVQSQLQEGTEFIISMPLTKQLADEGAKQQ